MAGDVNDPNESSRHLGPMLAIGLVFFIFGFVTWLNGPLIGFVKLAFDLDDVNAFLVPMVFYLSYLVFALPASALLRQTGMKKGIALGFLVAACGSALFGECALRRYYPGALMGLFVTGAGLSLLQTASNPYISILGPIDSAARRIAFMGICNKFAGFLAPLVFGALVLRGMDNLEERVRGASPEVREILLAAFAAQVHWPYMAMSLLMALLAVWFMRSNLPDIVAESSNRTEGFDHASALRFRQLRLGVVALFLYVGVEVMAGDAIVIYGAGFGLPLNQTSLFTSWTLFAMLAGYCTGLAVIPRFISQQAYLALSAAAGVLLSLGALTTGGHVSIGFVAALGFANAMMWPAIFPLAINGLGRHTETGAAMLIMAIAGGAVLPYLYALLKTQIGFQTAFAAICIPAYLFILHYGWRGHRFLERHGP